MGFRIPATAGAVSGLSLLAFVLGVATATGGRGFYVPFLALSLCLSVGVFALAVPIPNSIKALIVIVLSFVFGIWRVEVTPRPSLRRIGNVSILAASTAPSTGIAAALTSWREIVTRRIASVLPPADAALVSGILYGERGLPKTERDVFRASGLMHLVAVSGSNVTVLVQFISILVSFFRLRRRQTFIVTSFVILVFVGFVGFSASVARAAFMGWLVLLARETGRAVKSFHLLLVAAVILLLINPWQLFYDIGFALSFLATWGILAWMPLIDVYCGFLPRAFGIREAFAMTVAATLCTAPYSAWVFDQLTLVGLLTNVFAAPLVPFIMGFGVIVAAWGNFPGGTLISLPALGLSRLLLSVAEIANIFPWMNMKITGMKLSTLVCSYALIVYFWLLLTRKNELSTDK
ncbi:MAG: ComEC/Rec2 family competence protein [Patescibacteria group bacterium]